MLVNRVMPARHLLTVREMVESFAPDLLSVTAVQSRRPDGWWRLSYGELRDWVRSLGTALLAAGVRPGDRVGVISENRSEWVITYLAVTCVGAVIVPLDVLLKAEELGAVMKAAGPVLVFTSTEYLEKVQKAHAIAGASARLVMFDAHALVTPSGRRGAPRRPRRARRSLPRPRRRPRRRCRSRAGRRCRSGPSWRRAACCAAGAATCGPASR